MLEMMPLIPFPDYDMLHTNLINTILKTVEFFEFIKILNHIILQETQAAPSRGRGRGRGRGRKRNSDKARIGESSEKPEDNEALSSPQLTDDECDMSPKSQVDEGQSSGAAKDSTTSNSQCPLKGFDLNMGLDENGEVPATETESEPHQSEWLGAGFPGVDPNTLHQDQSGFLQEEDYDCEDED